MKRIKVCDQLLEQVELGQHVDTAHIPGRANHILEQVELGPPVNLAH